MDKIYSRRRIKIPFGGGSFRANSPNRQKKIKKFSVIVVVFLIAFLTVKMVMQAIEPILEKQCETISKSIATKICNEEATKVMANYKYDDLCVITRDTSGNIAMLSANMITVNEIISDIAIRIQEQLNNTENSSFSIKLGTFTGSKLLSGRGPDIAIKLSTIGNIDTDLKSEFQSSGINQTLHKIYLEVKCNVVVLTPFDTSEKQITNQVLLAESVILGTTPNTYYNLEGLDKQGALEVVE